MSQSANDPQFILIAPPESNRVALFQQALTPLQLAPARVISYLDLLAGRITLPQIMQADSLLRLESPGKDFAHEQALLALGANVEDTEDCVRISAQEVRRLSFEKGRILWPRQWYLGFREALRQIEGQLLDCESDEGMNTPRDIAVMFDKPRCHEWLHDHHIRVPRSLGTIRSFDELMAQMQEQRCPRVFVKLAHGSSASGVVAYQTNGRQQQATTTVEMVRHNGERRLYNSRRLRTYREQHEIAALIDELCRHRVHVEQWLPKANLGGKSFDLRVVVINRKAHHVVARLSHSPITNLHLLNERREVEAIQLRIGEAAWQAAMETCERVMQLFPGSFYAGIDLLITADFQQHAVLEVNAFGDLLPGVLWQGMDTYTAEIKAMLERRSAFTVCRTHDKHAEA
jgi:glutathione synthase/RimK-type ligase-like ATP-grasp enzyme